MTVQKSNYSVRLVYSYSHKDSKHRQDMETALSQLTREGILVDWSDSSILPGQGISAEFQRKLAQADVVVFLLSPDFLASEECMNEWARARLLASDNARLVRIPIILRPCAWKDFMGQEDLKALPTDAQPVTEFSNPDNAWLDVYDGIKAVVLSLRSTFTPNRDFLTQMEQTDFVSQKGLSLSDLFVFLPLTSHKSAAGKTDHIPQRLTTPDELLDKPFSIVHGGDRTGKTALARYMFLTLVDRQKPVLYVDLKEVPHRPNSRFFPRVYEDEFDGDYDQWVKQIDKTLILEDLSGRADLIGFVETATQTFERIIITAPTNVYYSFYRDASRLATFEELEISELTHDLQETLIRKRLALRNDTENVDDSLVDRAEDKVNSVILRHRVVPRFPFFVLCILQTFEAYMPSGLTITSYGHCYYALIVASLIRAGVSQQDSDINACFNFAEHLAFAVYKHKLERTTDPFDFPLFVEHYRNTFVIPNSAFNRLKDPNFGLIDDSGKFRSAYMHYFFLGKYLSRGNSESRQLLQQMCDSTHLPASFLTLLFTIHHTTNIEIIDDILTRTICTLDEVPVATLDRAETSRFAEIVAKLPKEILSVGSVESERKKAREAQPEDPMTVEEAEEAVEVNGASDHEVVNDIYRILKNNEIMGQVLRNKYGSITKDTLEEVIETMADAGLRLVNLILKSEEEIAELAQYIKTQNPKFDIAQLSKELQLLSFLWTMNNLEHVVRSVNIPEVKASIDKVVGRKGTAAYDIIGYFTLLDTATTLDEGERKALENLLRKHKDSFVRGVISLRTQQYLNTHRTKAPIEQSFCSLLGIRYVPRLVAVRR